MKLDVVTIAALVTACTSAVATTGGLIQIWRSSASRAYTRLGQLLTMRAQIPDTLHGVQRTIDYQIARVAEPLAPLDVAVTPPPWLRESIEKARERRQPTLLAAFAVISLIGVGFGFAGIWLLTFSHTTVAHGVGLYFSVNGVLTALGAKRLADRLVYRIERRQMRTFIRAGLRTTSAGTPGDADPSPAQPTATRSTADAPTAPVQGGSSPT